MTITLANEIAMEQDRRAGLHRRLVEGELRMGRVPDEVMSGLADPHLTISRVLEGDSDWAAVFAIALHIAYAKNFLESLDRRLRQDDVLWRLENLVSQSRVNAPQMPRDFSRSPISIDHDPRWSIYFHARCALAMLICDGEPETAIELLEPLRDLFPPRTNDSLSWDISIIGRRMFWGMLKRLYAKAQDYRNALDMHLVGFGISGIGDYEEAHTYFDGWLAQLLGGSASVADWRYLIDVCTHILERCSNTDQDERETLAECSVDSPQFWAWKEGYVAGTLSVQKRHVVLALIEEAKSSDWVAGWPVVSLTIAYQGQTDWGDARKQSLDLYHAADIEYGGTAVPYGERKPPHLSPQSDLYWAMRVGFADAHLNQDEDARQPSLTDIKNNVETIEAIVTAHSQRELKRSLEEAEQLDQIRRALSRSDEEIRGRLQSHLGSVWAVLPPTVIGHLTDAERLWETSVQPDYAILAFSKSTEALIHEHIVKRVEAEALSGGEKDLELIVPRNRREQGRYSIKQLGYLQLWQWSEILATTGAASSPNERFAALLRRIYPTLDSDLLGKVAEELREISQARGPSAHHYQRDRLGATDRERMQTTREGLLGLGRPSVIVSFYEALGLAGSSGAPSGQ